MIACDRYRAVIAAAPLLQRSGRLRSAVGLAIVASGPATPLGEVCRIHTKQGIQDALVVGFRNGETILQPLGGTAGLRPGDLVEATGRGLEVRVGPDLVGRVLDGLGRPIDDRGPLPGRARRSVDAPPPPPLARRPIETVLETGLKTIDAFCTLGHGQRIGIFANAGLGKSILMGELARTARCDVAVVALIGERGREVGDFVTNVLGPEGLARSVVLVATSDRPAVERLAAAAAAHAVAEHFRDAGLNVLLMMDSLTRFCQAAREVGLAAGEPPTVRGYPPSAFARLAPLLERAGTGMVGSITGIYTVLVDGEESEDPVADNVRAILDGHLSLSRQLAERSIYPAIDPARSVSRLMVDIVDQEHLDLATRARGLWGEYERVRDLVDIGAYRSGADARSDEAIALRPHLETFLRQGLRSPQPLATSLAELRSACAVTGEAA